MRSRAISTPGKLRASLPLASPSARCCDGRTCGRAGQAMVDARRLARSALVACASLALLAAALWFDVFGLRGDAGLERALTERGRGAVAGQALLGTTVQGARLVDAQSAPAVWQ